MSILHLVNSYGKTINDHQIINKINHMSIDQLRRHVVRPKKEKKKKLEVLIKDTLMLNEKFSENEQMKA
jgi:hypothetical protein